MSSSNDEETPEHPWLSLAELLFRRTISVADLTTVIEKVGVKTYDRVGRLITATEGGEDERTSQTHALYYLACYYGEVSAAEYLPKGQHPSHDPHRLLGEGSPLNEFGWVKPDVPDFAKIIADEVKQFADLSDAKLAATLEKLQQSKHEPHAGGGPPVVEVPDPERRLALLRALGGNAKYRNDKWTFTGMAVLVKNEKGRKRSNEKTIRCDLTEAAKAEREAKQAAALTRGLGQRG